MRWSGRSGRCRLAVATCNCCSSRVRQRAWRHQGSGRLTLCSQSDKRRIQENKNSCKPLIRAFVHLDFLIVNKDSTAYLVSVNESKKWVANCCRDLPLASLPPLRCLRRHCLLLLLDSDIRTQGEQQRKCASFLSLHTSTCRSTPSRVSCVMLHANAQLKRLV